MYYIQRFYITAGLTIHKINISNYIKCNHPSKNPIRSHFQICDFSGSQLFLEKIRTAQIYRVCRTNINLSLLKFVALCDIL